MTRCYRCGWCGTPTSEAGSPLSLEQVEAWEFAEWDSATPVDGACCPQGDRSGTADRLRDEWERVMRIDAFGAP